MEGERKTHLFLSSPDSVVSRREGGRERKRKRKREKERERERDSQFFVDLIVRCWRLYASLADADMVDVACYAIQVENASNYQWRDCIVCRNGVDETRIGWVHDLSHLQELLGTLVEPNDERNIFARLPEECK